MQRGKGERDFSRLYLDDRDLSEVDLSGANLRCAFLDNVDLSRSVLPALDIE